MGVGSKRWYSRSIKPVGGGPNVKVDNKISGDWNTSKKSM